MEANLFASYTVITILLPIWLVYKSLKTKTEAFLYGPRIFTTLLLHIS